MNKKRSADKSVDLEFKNGHSEKYAAGSWTIYPQSPTKVRDFFFNTKKKSWSLLYTTREFSWNQSEPLIKGKLRIFLVIFGLLYIKHFIFKVIKFVWFRSFEDRDNHTTAEHPYGYVLYSVIRRISDIFDLQFRRNYPRFYPMSVPKCWLC